MAAGGAGRWAAAVPPGLGSLEPLLPKEHGIMLLTLTHRHSSIHPCPQAHTHTHSCAQQEVLNIVTPQGESVPSKLRWQRFKPDGAVHSTDLPSYSRPLPFRPGFDFPWELFGSGLIVPCITSLNIFAHPSLLRQSRKTV